MEAGMFHKYCDRKGAKLCIMRSTKRKVFGGFSMKNWRGDWYWWFATNYKRDEKAFIFSINLKKIYRPTDVDKAIVCDKNWGPDFGENSLSIVTF